LTTIQNEKIKKEKEMTPDKAAEVFVRGLEIFVKVLVISIFLGLCFLNVFIAGGIFMKAHLQGENCTVLMYGMVWSWSEALSLHLSTAAAFLVGLILFLFGTKKKSN